MNTDRKIQRALISVYDKNLILDIANELVNLGVEILSTGGTQQYLTSHNIPVTAVEDVTGYPSIFGGRVKTLHPKVMGGILFRREEAGDLTEREKYDIPGISGVDTRALTKILREKGTMNGMITTKEYDDLSEPIRRMREYQVTGVVLKTTAREKYVLPGNGKRVALMDYGAKRNIARSLNARGCQVTVYPADTPAEEVLADHPDGIMLSNGPGDPVNVPEVVSLVKELKGKVPMMGVCMGHQLISLAYGAKTYKLKFGHRGGNHPILNKETGCVEITAQNHSYAVDEKSLKGTGLSVTHVNLLDGTVEGVEDKKNKVFSVQFHPESAPGPQDSIRLFEKFIVNIEEWKKNA